jgi:type VI secretion system protein ImpF
MHRITRTMQRYRPSLFDCLLGEAPGESASHALPQLSLEQIKDNVARDLEALLNTRSSLPRDAFEEWPLSARSVLAYGMLDFSGMSLASPDDRRRICRSIEAAITSHEPRLNAVQVSLENGEAASQKLHFSIRAWLVAERSREPVNFDAVVHQTTQHYRVRRAARQSV